MLEDSPPDHVHHHGLMLAIGAEVDEGGAGLSQAGQTVLDVWAKLDAGAIADRAEAFDEADRRVREQQQAAAEE